MLQGHSEPRMMAQLLDYSNNMATPTARCNIPDTCVALLLECTSGSNRMLLGNGPVPLASTCPTVAAPVGNGASWTEQQQHLMNCTVDHDRGSLMWAACQRTSEFSLSPSPVLGEKSKSHHTLRVAHQRLVWEPND